MPDKKEIVDYLRNKQKAAEIEAKINGINIWVILGAISIVAWQLLLSINGKTLAQGQPILRAIICAQAIYLIIWSCGPARAFRNDIRFAALEHYDSESPFLNVVEGAVIAMPSALYAHFVGVGLSDGGIIYMGLIGCTMIFLGLRSLYFYWVGEAKRDKFPAQLGPTRKHYVIILLVSIAIFTSVINHQIYELRNQVDPIDVDFIRPAGLLSVLYVLILAALRRKQHSHSIEWTYELETDLLLGTTSPETALRKIESRSLGPRFQDVMDRIFDELDNHLSDLDQMLAECEKDFESINSVPVEYKTERSSRIDKACKAVLSRIDLILGDLEEFSAYLKRLTSRQRPGMAALLLSLAARQKGYLDKIRNARTQINCLVEKASTQGSSEK